MTGPVISVGSGDSVRTVGGGASAASGSEALGDTCPGGEVRDRDVGARVGAGVVAGVEGDGVGTAVVGGADVGVVASGRCS